MTDRFVVLLYHGVTREAGPGIENYSQKHITAEAFATQLEFLRAECNVMSYRTALTLRRSGSLPPRTVAVTFDDGFENNATVAYPILEEHRIPATFFIATGFIGTERVFWVDKVEFLINEATRSTIELPSLQLHLPIRTADEKIFAINTVKAALKSLPGMVKPVVAELEEASGTSPSYDYPNYRMMTWDMVQEMDGSDLVEFGSHTVDHEVLAHLETSEKRHQIDSSKETLERELGHDIDLFSYPEGQATHYDEETIGLLKASGYIGSPSAMFGYNDGRTTDFHIRRNMVGFTAPFETCIAPVMT